MSAPTGTSCRHPSQEHLQQDSGRGGLSCSLGAARLGDSFWAPALPWNSPGEHSEGARRLCPTALSERGPVCVIRTLQSKPSYLSVIIIIISEGRFDFGGVHRLSAIKNGLR